MSRAASTAEPVATSAAVRAFRRDGGSLAVGGMPVQRLAERVGSTPFFAYDRTLLSERIGLLRSTLPRSIELSYAIKANPMPAVVQHLSGLVDGFDCASGGELRTALDTPMPPSRISLAGPGKTAVELTQAIAAGVTIELGSETDAERAVAIGERLGIAPRVAVRVNPDFEVKGSGMRMGGGAQPFGVDAERVPALLTEVGRRELEFLGFHVFAGSQNLDAEVLCEAQCRTVELVLRLADAAPAPVSYVNLGGGFGIPYFDRDRPLDLTAIGQNLDDLASGVLAERFPGASVTIELGRYIVGECGVYVTRIVDRKESRGKVFLVVDGGMHHQLAASGNLGQVFRRNYPVAIADRIDDPAEESVNIVGCLCTPLDRLGDDVPLPRAGIGDLVAVFLAGAYGLTASPTAFLGHPPPVEVLV